jgi:hypothetical protein
MTNASVTNSVFIVGNKPFCVWHFKDAKADFLRSIDTNYFQYLAETHAAQLNGERRQHAALALRTAYHHGLETMFMLIFASLQAPNCVVGWLLKCRTETLRELVDGVCSNKQFLTKWNLEKMSWESVAALIIGKIFAHRQDVEELNANFARLWTRLASDYTNSSLTAEHNSFKHGFRAAIGDGPSISWTQSDDPDRLPNSPKTTVLCSKLGAWFFMPDKLQKAKAPDMRHHFRLNYCHTNFHENDLVSDLCLISISIKNIVAFLRIVNGPPVEEVEVSEPVDKSAFDSSGRPRDGLRYLAINPPVREDAIPQITEQMIIEHFARTKL